MKVAPCARVAAHWIPASGDERALSNICHPMHKHCQFPSQWARDVACCAVGSLLQLKAVLQPPFYPNHLIRIQRLAPCLGFRAEGRHDPAEV